MNKIYLTGFMASGKSIYGRELANLMSLKFIDLDNIIEEQENNSISDIFKNKGIDYFRDAEHKALLSTENEKNTVIATGGGTPVYFNHIRFMQETGFIVFLNTPLDIIFDRVENRNEKRPLLENYKGEMLKIFIAQLYKTRIEFYRQADLVINPMHITPAELVEYLKKKELRGDEFLSGEI